MQNVIHTQDNQPARDLAWRLILIGVMALLMCSCQAPGQTATTSILQPNRPAVARLKAPMQQESDAVVASITSDHVTIDQPPAVQQVHYQQPAPGAPSGPPTSPALPRSAWTGQPPAGVDIPHGNSGGIPYPDNWRPPGIPGPWPADEYLRQGGDREQTVNVAKDWSIDNLDSEDAVVHYHTLDGSMVVQPTNRLSIYAPRFGSVRRMDGMIQLDNQVKLAGVDVPTRLGHRNSAQSTWGMLQQMQPQRNLVVRSSSSYREKTSGIDLYNRENVLSDMNIDSVGKHHQHDQQVQLENSEKPRLGESATRAEDQVIKQSAQVTLDDKPASENVSFSGLGKVHIYHMPQGKSRLRITKTSPSSSARPGDTIEFTIHFENVGTQTVGNVTVVDHLTSRLEYVEDSQQASLKADFFIQESVQEGTTVLRWEIIDPLAIGKSGEVTFTCRVR
ncbi:MAG: DUF11 domain-containing protein [Planctomycetota bacterium]|nr:DUF11 domain-containing protein [Planctomycetota bacterium]